MDVEHYATSLVESCHFFWAQVTLTRSCAHPDPTVVTLALVPVPWFPFGADYAPCPARTLTVDLVQPFLSTLVCRTDEAYVELSLHIRVWDNRRVERAWEKTGSFMKTQC